MEAKIVQELRDGHSWPCAYGEKCVRCRAADIIAKLPLTADGMPVVPGVDTVYRMMYVGKGETAVKGMREGSCPHHLFQSSYSTRAAAEAAKGGGA